MSTASFRRAGAYGEASPTPRPNPMQITPEGGLEVNTHDFVLIRGRPKKVRSKLRAALPEKPALVDRLRSAVRRMLGRRSR